MTVGSRFQASSQRLINRYGKTRVYVHKKDGEYNLDTQKVENTQQLISVKMFKTDPKEREIKSPNLVNKLHVVMMISAVDLTIKPNVGDEIRDHYLGVDEVYQVVQVKVNESSDEVVTWRLICVAS